MSTDAVLVCEAGVVRTRLLGCQRSLLSLLESQGPRVLVAPQDIYSACIQAGLLPRPTSINDINPGPVRYTQPGKYGVLLLTSCWSK